MKQRFLGPMLAMLMFASPSLAAEKLSNSERMQLQAAMKTSISRQLVDGQYLYFDAKTDEVAKIYPVRAHPMILQMGPHYILCSNFRNKHGRKINIDFYVTRRDNRFVVFDTVINNRKPIERMMKAGLAYPIK